MSTGIVMIAIGHENYVKMAVNLAASIKCNSKLPIHLIHDDKWKDLLFKEQSLFDSNVIPIDKHWHSGDQTNPIKAKTRLYDLSPFDNTLYLDVDIIWLNRPIDGLIDELKGVEFAIMNKGKEEVCWWADPADIRAITGNEHPMYWFYSELIYFQRGDRMKDFFRKVKENYDKPKVKCKTFGNSHMPDELAYIMASLQTGVLPHKDGWLPVYWYLRDTEYRHLQPYQLADMFYAYSIGGNVTPSYAKAHYNNLATHYANSQGLKKPYQVRDKRSYIAERQKY